MGHIPWRRLLPIVAMLVLLPSLAAALPEKGRPAPPFQVTSLSGQKITPANYQGYVLLVEFFATWCGPCRESIPSLLRLNARHGGKGFQILGLSIDDNGQKELRSFAREMKLTYPVAMADDDLQAAYGVRSVPVMFLINRKGQIIERYMGYAEEYEKEIETAILRALAEK